MLQGRLALFGLSLVARNFLSMGYPNQRRSLQTRHKLFTRSTIRAMKEDTAMAPTPSCLPTRPNLWSKRNGSIWKQILVPIKTRKRHFHHKLFLLLDLQGEALPTVPRRNTIQEVHCLFSTIGLWQTKAAPNISSLPHISSKYHGDLFPCQVTCTFLPYRYAGI